MSKLSPDVVLATLFQTIRAELDQLPAETFARVSGFLKRTPRKIPIPALLAALVALGAARPAARVLHRNARRHRPVPAHREGR